MQCQLTILVDYVCVVLGHQFPGHHVYFQDEVAERVELERALRQQVVLGWGEPRQLLIGMRAGSDGLATP
jgi:hypothetical protein